VAGTERGETRGGQKRIAEGDTSIAIHDAILKSLKRPDIWWASMVVFRRLTPTKAA
jgi:hypothetical protein